jgi:hypothetical protein
MSVEVRRWRRGLSKVARRPIRATRNIRPPAALGVVLICAILGSGAAAGAAIGVAAVSQDEPAFSQSQFHRHPIGPWDGTREDLNGQVGPWGHDWPPHR